MNIALECPELAGIGTVQCGRAVAPMSRIPLNNVLRVHN